MSTNYCSFQFLGSSRPFFSFSLCRVMAASYAEVLHQQQQQQQEQRHLVEVDGNSTSIKDTVQEPQMTQQARSRVKVYELDTATQGWVDKGTGHLHCTWIEVRCKNHTPPNNHVPNIFLQGKGRVLSGCLV
jgi:hypothetical protein